MKQTYSIPRWMTGYLVTEALLVAIFTYFAYATPGILFTSWPVTCSANALTLAGPIGLYLARSMATVVTTLLAIAKKSIVTYMLAFTLYAIANGINFVHYMINGNYKISIIFLVLFAVELTIFLKLNKQQAPVLQ